MEEHHLYEIINSEENDVLKYGICGKPLRDDGKSPRAEEQVRFLNRIAGWLQYFSRVILTKIKGRKKAEEIEEEYIQEYAKIHGHRPKGNPPRGKDFLDD